LINNKWKHGKVSFKLPEDLPINFFTTEMIYYIPMTLDPDIGEEICLAIYDPTDFIYTLKNTKPLDLFLNVGVVKTSQGPLLILLFYVPNYLNPSDPIYGSDRPLNPFDDAGLKPWFKLADQTHWHVILVNKELELVDLFEFENVFKLREGLETGINTVKDLKHTNYIPAVSEYFTNYNMFDILK